MQTSPLQNKVRKGFLRLPKHSEQIRGSFKDKDLLYEVVFPDFSSAEFALQKNTRDHPVVLASRTRTYGLLQHVKYESSDYEDIRAHAKRSSSAELSDEEVFLKAKQEVFQKIIDYIGNYSEKCRAEYVLYEMAYDDHDKDKSFWVIEINFQLAIAE